jgi:hypothetical protein
MNPDPGASQGWLFLIDDDLLRHSNSFNTTLIGLVIKSSGARVKEFNLTDLMNSEKR